MSRPLPAFTRPSDGSESTTKRRHLGGLTVGGLNAFADGEEPWFQYLGGITEFEEHFSTEPRNRSDLAKLGPPSVIWNPTVVIGGAPN